LIFFYLNANILTFKVGIIGVTYDNPSHILPYPIGYQHDLSLIIRTGERKLPDLVPPRGIRLSPKWASLSAALSGDPLFTCTFSPEKVVTGEILAEDTREALIHGTSYHWQRESFHQSASILWRTAQEPFSVTGYSGSVLCLGQPYKGKANPLLFQNFEFSFEGLIIKGGFILPKEVQMAKILLGRQTNVRRKGKTQPPSGRRARTARRINNTAV
jgi:hypothetical protein